MDRDIQTEGRRERISKGKDGLSALSFNIYLIGFMGCGKSTATEYLRDVYGMHAVEMDREVERSASMTIQEIFAEKGEPAFRRMETELLRKLAGTANSVVSCGGGAAMREENVELMHQGGKVVLLLATPETILSRVSGDNSRPLLNGQKNIEDIRAMMEKRRPAYEAAADITVNTDGRTEAEIASEILRKCGAV